MASKDLNTLYCAYCGSSNVEMTMWVNPNTGENSGQSSDRFEEEDCWCKNCTEHVRLLTLEELWDQFSEVPVNNDDEIEEDFLFFSAGTSKFDVWHWFDERCPNNLHDDLMNP
ncbi:MAG: hypothetical protein ACI3ZD_15770 [Prevotella sp.]